MVAAIAGIRTQDLRALKPLSVPLDHLLSFFSTAPHFFQFSSVGSGRLRVNNNTSNSGMKVETNITVFAFFALNKV